MPIVEPEVLMDGGHPLERCAEVTEATLRAAFGALAEQGVELEGIVLKPNMVVAGKEAARQPGVAEVAEATLACLRRTVPAALPGIAFWPPSWAAAWPGTSPREASRTPPPNRPAPPASSRRPSGRATPTSSCSSRPQKGRSTNRPRPAPGEPSPRR